MLNFISNRLQKSLAKMQAKTTLNEADILEVTREIKLALLEADVNLKVVKEFINEVKEKALKQELISKFNPSQQMVKIVKEELVAILGKQVHEINLDSKKSPFIIMMTGLQGSGKTTTTSKIAKYFLKKKKCKKPLMVAADIYRPAAIEQLVSLGKQLNIDVFHEKNHQGNALQIVEKALDKAQKENYDLMIVDTAGRLSIDDKLMKELVDFKKILHPDKILFVVDALVGQDIINVAKTFDDYLKLNGSIITKLDSDARGGAALSITKVLSLPIYFIGNGEKTSNLDLFYPERIASRILGMGDVLSLIEKAEEVIDEKKSKRLVNRMMSGRFNLDDLLEQLQQMQKLGKMTKIFSMIPGIKNKISKDQISQVEVKMKLFKIIISSMTIEERKNPKLLKNASRKKRIMSGSGRNPQEYNRLINEFERMSKQMQNLSGEFKNGNMFRKNFK